MPRLEKGFEAMAFRGFIPNLVLHRIRKDVHPPRLADSRVFSGSVEREAIPGGLSYSLTG